MIELQPVQFSSILPLFAGMDYHLAIRAALTGCADGRAFADSAEKPRSAMVWTGHRLYFGGDAGIADFNHDLGRWLTGEVFPAAEGGVFTLYLDGAAWQRAVESAILVEHPPVSRMREYYELDLAETQAQSAALPEGFAFHAADRALAGMEGLEHLDDLLEEMQSERASVEDFLQHSFGTVIIDSGAKRLVTWCLSEYNIADRCEVGIATVEGYQRRGLAAAAGRAFAEQARMAGIRRIGWHCWRDNLPSAATARALGYQRVREDPGYLLFTNPVTNLAVHGDARLYEGDYRGALDWFERAFQRGAGAEQSWAFLRAACAAARLGERERAFGYLNQAVDYGTTNADRLLKIDDLEPLRGSAEWLALMGRLGR